MPATRSLNSNCSGQVLMLVAISLTSLMAMTGLAIDLSRAYHEQRSAQHVADAASLSAVGVLAEGGTFSAAREEAHRVILLHGYSNSDIVGNGNSWNPTVNSGGILTGTYPSGGPFSPGTASPTAVQVRLQRTVMTSFARVMHFQSLFPAVRSTAVTGPGGAVDCALPFTVTRSAITGGSPPALLPIGSTFQTNNSGPGNWGTFENGTVNFFEAINGASGSCGNPLSVGSTPTTDTGNPNQIRDAFNAHLNSIYVFPIADAMPNGHHQFTILGFIKARVLGASGSGSHMVANFRVEDYVVGTGNPSSPPPGGFGQTRVLAE